MKYDKSIKACYAKNMLFNIVCCIIKIYDTWVYHILYT